MAIRGTVSAAATTGAGAVVESTSFDPTTAAAAATRGAGG